MFACLFVFVSNVSYPSDIKASVFFLILHLVGLPRLLFRPLCVGILDLLLFLVLLILILAGSRRYEVINKLYRNESALLSVKIKHNNLHNSSMHT